jgi:hypothetical protein
LLAAVFELLGKGEDLLSALLELLSGSDVWAKSSTITIAQDAYGLNHPLDGNRPLTQLSFELAGCGLKSSELERPRKVLAKGSGQKGVCLAEVAVRELG